MIASEGNELKFSPDKFVIAGILLVAAGLRFALLGSHPLNDHEATLALQAMAVSRGQETMLSGEPGYLSLTAAMFFLFGVSDFMARIWPALFGSCAVLLPFLYRPWLGRKSSLWLAGFIALDPILIWASRAADGSMLAMVGLLAGIGFLLKKKPVLSGICLGLALVGGPEIWTGLILLGVVALVGRVKFSKHDSNSLSGFTKRDWVTTGGSAVASLILISTFFLTKPVGVSAIGSSIVKFLASMGETSGTQFLGMGIAWWLMELPVIILALWGFIEGVLRKDEGMGLLGVGWGLALLLAIVTPATGVIHFLWVSLPMLVLAAIKVKNISGLYSNENRLIFFSEAVLVVALVIFSFLNLLSLVNNAYLATDETRNRIIGTLLPVILLVALTVLLSWGWSFSSTRKGFIAGVLVLFSLLIFSNAWKAAGLGSRPQNELGHQAGYPTGAEPLKATIADISRWNTGFDNRIDISVVAMEQPSLLWALRDFDELNMESGYNPNLSPSLILTGIDKNISSSTSYRGQKFQWAVKPDPAAMKLTDWIKWAIFRTAPVQRTELVLWARNDLFFGTSTP